ncbi:hypothetical protein B7463_g6381, partial [Scytalidium lignicola]
MSPSARERLIEAKKWLADNPGESQSAAAKIFKVNKSTLNMSILRGDLGPCGGQNKILTISQEKAVYTFIKSYLENRQVPTKEIVFKAICFVQKQHGKPSPSFNWFAQDYEDVKESTIQNAFKKASIWLVNKKATFELMKKYVKKDPEVPKKIELELPTPGTPQTIHQVQYQLDELRPKIIEIVNKKKKEQKAAWVAWRAKERLRKKAIKELSSNMLVILTEDQYKPQGIVIYDSVSTEVKEVVEQKGEQEMEQEEEEDFICFNLSANMEYNY